MKSFDLICIHSCRCNKIILLMVAAITPAIKTHQTRYLITLRDSSQQQKQFLQTFATILFVVFFLQLYFFLVWFHKDFMRVEIFFLYFFFLECRPRLLKTEHPFNGYISLQTTTCHVAHNNHLLSSEFSYNVIRSPRQQFYTTAVISGCKLHNLVMINSQTNDKRTRKVSNK